MLTDNGIFDSLSRMLGDGERKALLGKIKDSLQLHPPAENEVQDFGRRRFRDIKQVRQAIEKLPWYSRLWLLLRHRVTGKNLVVVFSNYRTAQLKKAIRRRMPGLTGFETRDLSPDLAAMVFRIYQRLLPLRPLTACLWAKGEYFESFAAGMIASASGKGIPDLETLFPRDEMVRYLLDGTGKEGLKRILFERIENFVGDIPADLIVRAEETVLPFYYLKDLVLFPFADFFQLFHFRIAGSDVQPRFQKASANLALPYLETLYRAILLGLRGGSAGRVDPAAIKWLIRKVRESEVDCQISAELDYAKSVAEALAVVQTVNKKVPLGDLIRYFRRSPFLSFNYSAPQLELAVFYESYLKIRLTAEFDEQFSHVLQLFLDQKIHRLFDGPPREGLHNFKTISIAEEGKTVSLFHRAGTLNLIYGYLKQFYESFHSEVIGFLANDLFGGERGLKDKLVLHSTVLEDLVPRIDRLDQRLSQDSEDGRYFHQLRNSLASDSSQRRMFLLEVEKIEREAASITEEGRASVEGLIEAYSSAERVTTPALQRVLNNHYIVRGKAVLLRQLVKQRIEHLAEFRQILHFVRKIER